jgi:hypothetical protein
MISVRFAPDERRPLQGRGVGTIITNRDRPTLPSVGNDPDAISLMRGADGRSWYTVPDRIEPERGQVSENGSHPETKQAWNVLHDDVAGSNLANEAPVFAPETRSRTFEASSLASERDVLAREPAADDINGNSIGSKSCCGKLSDIFVAGDIRPMFRQDLAAGRIDLAEGLRLEAARALQPKAEAADA